MTDESQAGKVVELRPIAERLTLPEGAPRADAELSEVSYDIELDEPGADADVPVFVDAPLQTVEVRPIIPDNLRGLPAIRDTIKQVAGKSGHIAGFHAVRALPVYTPKAIFWAIIGLFKLLGAQLAWWWDMESLGLRQAAATNNDAKTYRELDKDARIKRGFRGWVLLFELIALGVVVALLCRLPWWQMLIAAVPCVTLLAYYGQPTGKPIIGRAIVAPRYRRLNADIVLRAYYAAKLGRADKEDERVEFGSVMSRDKMNTGSQVIVDLPYGGTFDDVKKAKSKIASGLDVTEYQVFLTRDKTSTRRHLLFVADRDPLAIPAGRTPMLDLKVRDIWAPCLIGLDERGQKVYLDLLWNSFLIGAQPRKGKTFSARLLALYAALDPYVKLFLADGKDSPDWRSFVLVADRMVFGTAPTARGGDPVEKLLDMLRHIKKHIQRVNQILSELPVEMCPEGKLTRELARDLRYPELRIWMLVMEEFQVYYELDDQETNKEVAGLLSFIMAVGPSAGVVLVSSTQKPAGIGAGDVTRLFNRFRDNHSVRLALKCGTRDVSMAILGGDAYGEGYDASSLPLGDEYRGVGYLYGASDRTPTVRNHLADKLDAQEILKAARRHRELLGTLSGEASGDMVLEGELIDPLADALAVIQPSEVKISWPRLAARLAEQLPDRYADIAADAISARLRGIGAKSKSVRDPEFFKSGVGQGVARGDLEQLAARRAVS
jgi:S-DNA-T family DNA segregation ATPase FtsK/SpoIIIE